jgi:hypothetical protein
MVKNEKQRLLEHVFVLFPSPRNDPYYHISQLVRAKAAQVDNGFNRAGKGVHYRNFQFGNLTAN